MAISRSNTFESVESNSPLGSTKFGASKDTKYARDSENTKDARDGMLQVGPQIPVSAGLIYDRFGGRRNTKDVEAIANELLADMMRQYMRHGIEEADLTEIMLVFDDKSYVHMDDCIRWLVFVKSLTSKESSKRDAASAFTKWFVVRFPLLAFASLNNTVSGEAETGPADEVLSLYHYRGCRAHSKHTFPPGLLDIAGTPFHIAAKTGNHQIIDLILAEALVALSTPPPFPDSTPSTPSLAGPSDKLLTLVLAGDPTMNNGDSALKLALQANTAPLETLKSLLSVPGFQLPPDDESFPEAVRLGFDLAVKTYFDRGLRLDAETFKESIAAAFKAKKMPPRGTRQKKSVRSEGGDPCLEVIMHLIRDADTPDKFTRAVAQNIIENNLVQVWNVKKPGVPDRETSDCLLHTAVLYENLEFVEIFVKAYPQSLQAQEKVPNESKEDGKYPLWYNNHKWDPKKMVFVPLPLLSDGDQDTKRAKIRNVIVTEMIQNLDMDQVSDIFHSSHEPFKDLCFDMSRFNSSRFLVSDFINSLIHQDAIEQGLMSKYEHTLRYVEFPSLDAMADHREVFKESTNFATKHDEVFRVLDWLAAKGVKKIIRLVVPDRLVNPHDEIEMAQYVRLFQIEVLDWKVLDLSLWMFKEKVNKHPCSLRELYLYSSGKRAAVHHWFNELDGFLSLGDETCTAENANKLLGEIRSLRDEGIPLKITVHDPVEVSWYPAPSSADLSKIAHRLSPRLAKWLESLSAYAIKTDKHLPPNKRHKPTRVAILDNGVLSISPVAPDSSAGRGGTTKSNLNLGGQQQSHATGMELVAGAMKDVTNAVQPETNGVGSPKTTTTTTRRDYFATTSGTDMPQHLQQQLQQQKQEPQQTAPAESLTGGNNPGGSLDSNTPSSSSSSKNGAKDGSEQGLSSRIKAGRSFVDSNSKFCPWQFPSDPHGTQMANLVCALDPLCEIYVARVAEDSFGIKAENVARAIEWAIQEGVDIISMSFALSGYNKALHDVMEKAAQRGIIMTCSTHDEGFRATKAYPAAHRSDTCHSVFVLTACDAYGKLLRDVDDKEFDFKLLGDQVPAGVVPFVKSDEKITGSSVATALATGLCSLALTCDRLAHPEKKYKNESMLRKSYGREDAEAEDKEAYRFGVASKHLRDMQSGGSDSNSKFVLLEKFGHITKPGIGQDAVAQPVSKMIKVDVPAAEYVLEHRFGMERRDTSAREDK